MATFGNNEKIMCMGLKLVKSKTCDCVFVNCSYPVRRRRFRIDTEVRCVGAHPPSWPLEPARVKPN